jgi:ApbE superfamily uncharacterized protein (UPF0280 family)
MNMIEPRRTRDGYGRWHWRHGPIDLIVEAEGDPLAIQAAHASAWLRFQCILAELVAELPLLKRPVDACPSGPVARRMWRACRPHRARFITPMAAVAGAVADELIAHYRVPGITRAWINNGGDIALYLAPGASVRVGVFADLASLVARFPSNGSVDLDADFAIPHALPVRGIATSGWRGRSFSLGIADSVTVLARSAAEADAAATMIANEVTIDDARIVRRPASSLKDDCDLGDRAVTVDVPVLGVEAVRRALFAGLAHAEALRAADVIASCVLVCQGMMMTTGAPRAARLPPQPSVPHAVPHPSTHAIA